MGWPKGAGVTLLMLRADADADWLVPTESGGPRRDGGRRDLLSALFDILLLYFERGELCGCIKMYIR